MLSYTIHHFDELSSTQDHAKSLSDAPQGCVIHADVQSAGYGRAGRMWESAPGNLFLSLVVWPRCDVGDIPQLAFVTGLAAFETAQVYGALAVKEDLKLKWPNDLLLDGRKCAGLLIENCGEVRQEQGAHRVVIGLGMNIAHAPEEAACLKVSVSALEVRDTFLERFRALYERWVSGEWEALRKEWLSRSFDVGRVMQVNGAQGVISGAYQGVNADGHLLLMDEAGRVRTISSGDVELG